MELSYSDRVQAEQKQFSGVESIADRHAEIAKHVVRNYRWPRLKTVFGATNPFEFYALPAIKRIRGGGCTDIASIGSGDCSTEIGVARCIERGGVEKFKFHCIDLSPDQISRARRSIEKAGLQQHFRLIEADFNEWQPDRPYAVVMANYALHHVMNLEHLFSAIRSALVPDGAFCTIDFIGRNGHRRWPETLSVVRDIWAFLPDSKKFNKFFKRTFKEYFDQDCSKIGFEGIRSQDILPLCMENFGFESCLFGGGVAEVFYAQKYGSNFDPDDDKDRAFIDFVCRLNDLLIDCGAIKPTQMFAVMTTDRTAEPRTWRHWTPDFCVRQPGIAPSRAADAQI
jgi:ubiquinone/menaquinone biosynthesis C-methylase UbiE